MAKKQLNIRVEESVLEQLDKLSKQSGKTKTQLIEEAIQLLYSQETQMNSQIELYKRENEQLKMVIKVFQEREKAVEEVKNVYEKLINEKDERIKELQKQLKEKSKPFWKFW